MTIGIIPSRYGSSRLAGKPLARLGGIPMIQRVYELAKKSKVLDQVYVATDDQRIVQAVEAFGGRALMTSDDCRSGSDRVAQAADILGLSSHQIVVNIQGDQPVFHPESIDQLVAPFDSDTKADMTTLAFPIEDKREITDPKDVKVTFNQQGFALYFSRAQIPFPRDPDTKVTYYKHLGFYAYTKAFLDDFVRLPSGQWEEVEKLEQLRALEHGFSIRVVISKHDSPEIDLPEDIARIETRLFSS